MMRPTTRLRLLSFLFCFAAGGKFLPGAAAESVRDTDVAIFAPRPKYPYEARRKQLTGSGIAELTVDLATGRVTNVVMIESTGHDVLDEETVSTFRRWRFKPGRISRVRTPINFVMPSGGEGAVVVQQKPMQDVLARFLGAGTLIQGKLPEYPGNFSWSDKQGAGVYELHVGKDGRVTQVKILKSSQDATFDRITVEALQKWRLRRGPLVIELPLGFTLTKDQCSVFIPKRH
jgi:TonB family protein